MLVIELEVGNADRMLRDVLTRLTAIDQSPKFRRSCREGICGRAHEHQRQELSSPCDHLRSLPSAVVLKLLPELPGGSIASKLEAATLADMTLNVPAIKGRAGSAIAGR